MPDISGLIEHFPYIALFVLLVFGGVGFPFPEDATLILCGFLISHDLVKPVRALLIVYAGLLLADIFLYAVGRKYGRVIVAHRRFQKIISAERLLMLEEKFKKTGVLFILIGRHLIGLRAQIFLAAGVMRMSVVKFIIADAFSSLFTIAVMVGAGYIGGNSLQILRKDISRIEHAGILIVVIFLIIYLFFKYFKSGQNKAI